MIQYKDRVVDVKDLLKVIISDGFGLRDAIRIKTALLKQQA
jgi:hypothetical protein